VALAWLHYWTYFQCSPILPFLRRVIIKESWQNASNYDLLRDKSDFWCLTLWIKRASMRYYWEGLRVISPKTARNLTLCNYFFSCPNK
jgi:hypothetical protein